MSCHPASSVQAGPHLAVSENQKAGVYMSPQHSVCCSLLFLLTFVCWQGHSSTVSPGGHSSVQCLGRRGAGSVLTSLPAAALLPCFPTAAGLKCGTSAWLGTWRTDLGHLVWGRVRTVRKSTEQRRVEPLSFPRWVCRG